MIDYHQRVRDAEQFGAVRVPGTAEVLWRLMVRGMKVADLTTEELDRLARGLAFRLQAEAVVVPTPSGIEAKVGPNETVHLCYSDQAEELARAVHRASGLDEVAR